MIRVHNAMLKPMKSLASSITNISIVGDERLEPYIRTFQYESENIAMAALGSVIGIFEIEDHSEESAYIVNLLASIVKKEYFAHPKRPAVESLEATLHKINMMLSELIKEDNTAWLGNLNATLCVLEKNNIHFSVSGKAGAFLIRDKTINNIGKGLAETEDPHPLKTFIEVASGRLNDGDKIILTTPGLFEVCSPEELRKNAARFSVEKFTQFVKTALVNKLLIGGALIIDIAEAESAQEIIITKSDAKPQKKAEIVPNAFSQSSFAHSKKKKEAIVKEQKDDIQEDALNHPEYTDSKTGHIYVQGNELIPETNEALTRLRWITEEVCTTCLINAKTVIGRSLKNIRAQNIPVKTMSFAKTTGRHTLRGMTWLWQLIRTIIPHLSLISRRFSQLSPRHKRFALGALFFIFILPFLWVRFHPAQKPIASVTPEISLATMHSSLENDTRIRFIATTSPLLTNTAVLSIVMLDDTLFAITDHSIINLIDPYNTKEYTLPSSVGKRIVQASPMSDLDTIFLLTDANAIVSFTPLNHAFVTNHINLGTTTRITALGTYLTYLYVLDDEHNTITRYPRAEGGFGEGVTWLKETTDIAEHTAMTVNENIYLAHNDRIVSLNRGKAETMSFESSTTPFSFTALYAVPNASSLYALDATNGRIVRFEKSGAITAQYAHNDLKEATSFTVDKNENRAFFVTPSGISSFELE